MFDIFIFTGSPSVLPSNLGKFYLLSFCCDPTSAVRGVLDICRQTIAINTISDLTSAHLSNIAKQQNRWTGRSTFHSNKGENRTWDCQ